MPTLEASQSLAPSLLVSMPQMRDPNFERSVILLCEHNADAAFGLVLNRRTDTPASNVVRLMPPVSSTSSFAGEKKQSGLELWIGGPVEPERGWILMGSEPEDVEAVQVCDGIFLSTSSELLRNLLEGPSPPRTRLLTGYAGWDAGQLEAELATSAWLNAEIDLNIIFETHPNEMWDAVIRGLGADPALLKTGGASVH
ncbi:uncharacterized protein METZ01_LOCUS360799 [marine metagenome]|uniref:Uncharacterized protein n=1 Tax=marine metagenome TaxID=408172 RepID=A0A382SEP7_9ZZZZ